MEGSPTQGADHSQGYRSPCSVAPRCSGSPRKQVGAKHAHIWRPEPGTREFEEGGGAGAVLTRGPWMEKFPEALGGRKRVP